MSAARFEVYSARLSAGTELPSVTWRLLSSNNRNLGRPTGMFATIQECLGAIAALRRYAPVTVPSVQRAGRGTWQWRVSHASVDLAVSARTYQRQLQAEAAVLLFLSLVIDADVTTRQAGTVRRNSSAGASFDLVLPEPPTSGSKRRESAQTGRLRARPPG